MTTCKLLFNSSLDNIIKCNDSFDSGVLRIAYHGENRNGSFISKETMERCAARSIFNVPVVANYRRETNTIGGHDAKIVRKNGIPTLVNITQPIGVVPESASFWWENITEENGEVHEYLCTDVLLWKRQEAYAKIKDDGITSESMEIDIKKSHREGKLLIVEDFEFQAFCLLGDVKPCFESASLAMFNEDDFCMQFSSMLAEIPDAINFTQNPKGVKNLVIKEKLKLMDEYGLTIDDIDFELEDYTCDELKKKFEAMKAACKKDDDKTSCSELDEDFKCKKKCSAQDDDFKCKEKCSAQDDFKCKEKCSDQEDEPDDIDDVDPESDNEEDEKIPNKKEDFDDGDTSESTGDGTGGGTETETDTGDNTSTDPNEDNTEDTAEDDSAPAKTKRLYALDSEFTKELNIAIAAEMIDCDGYICPRYFIIDYDPAINTVYCIDTKDHWITVRMDYVMNGDHIVVDFNSAKRVKVTFADFDEGSVQTSDSEFSIEQAVETYSRAKVECATKKYSAELDSVKEELSSLKRHNAEESIFAKFVDLSDNEEFQNLRENCADFDVDMLEEKCFAIRGRVGNFSLNSNQKNGPHKLPVDTHYAPDYEPYGGIVKKYI